MDGHSTHTYKDNIAFCRANMINACFFPSHTSHIIQPLDVSIFNSYKAAFRAAAGNPALEDINFNWITEATRNRLKTLGKSLIAFSKGPSRMTVRRAFYKTGIYPCSFEHFIYFNMNQVREIPEDAKARAEAVLLAENMQRSEKYKNRRKTNIVNNFMVVEAYDDL